MQLQSQSVNGWTPIGEWKMKTENKYKSNSKRIGRNEIESADNFSGTDIGC